MVAEWVHHCWPGGTLFLWDPWEGTDTSQNFCLKDVQQEVYQLAFPPWLWIAPRGINSPTFWAALVTYETERHSCHGGTQFKGQENRFGTNGLSMQLWLKSEVDQGGVIQGARGICYNSFYCILNHKINHILLLMSYPQEEDVLHFKGITEWYPIVIEPEWTLFQN